MKSWPSRSAQESYDGQLDLNISTSMCASCLGAEHDVADSVAAVVRMTATTLDVMADSSCMVAAVRQRTMARGILLAGGVAAALSDVCVCVTHHFNSQCCFDMELYLKAIVV